MPFFIAMPQAESSQYKKYHCPTTAKTSKGVPGAMPPPASPLPLPDSKRQFLSSLLEVLVRQLAWPEDVDWEAPGAEDLDPDDDMAQFQRVRTVDLIPGMCQLHAC